MSGHVLVVDDEQSVRQCTVHAVQRLGLSAAGCADGVEALRYIKTGPHTDLVILDFMMPGLNGLETLRLLKQVRPDLPVLIVSGFCRNETASELLQAGAAGFLQKPFTLEEVSRELERLIPPQDA